MDKVHGKGGTTSEEEDIDDLIKQLDDGEDEYLAKYRDHRLEELSEQMKKVKKNVESGNYGTVKTFHDEQQLISASSSAERCVVHFFIDSFKKCQLMDSKLLSVAETNLTTRFFRISVEECPFLVQKLSLKVLPVVIAYKHGIEQDRLIGFSKLGDNPDDFSIQQLERWLIQSAVVPKKDAKLLLLSKHNKQVVKSAKRDVSNRHFEVSKDDDSDDDDYWD
ncbi:Phosducin-like protein 1 [Kluyveromyces marxianus]